MEVKIHNFEEKDEDSHFFFPCMNGILIVYMWVTQWQIWGPQESAI